MKTLLILGGICSAMFASASLRVAHGAGGPASDATRDNSKLLEILKAPRISPATEEVVKLTESGADSTVIQSYVENSQAAYRLNADEIIYLHNHGVTDAIVSAMIQRGAALSDQAVVSQITTYAQPQPSVTTTYASEPAPTTYTAPQPVSTVTFIGTGYPYYYYPNYYSVSYPYYWYGYPWSHYYSRPYHYSWPRVGFNLSCAGHSHYRGPAFRSGFRGGYRGRH